MKKEKKEWLSSRRKRSLRRVLMAAAAVLLVNRIFLVGLLFPIQAIRHNEERMGTGRTAVICREWDPGFRWDFLAYLTKNENVTLLSGARLTYLGWMDAFGMALDCSEEAPIHAGTWFLNWGDRAAIYVFGRIDDPDIAELRVLWTIEGDEDSEMWWNVSKTEERVEEDGRRYFLCSYDNANAASYRVPLVVGYDEEGNEAARIELDQWASTSFA